MILEARAVSVRYRGLDVAALDGVSCGVAPGRLLAVVGPNGSGKTTLVRALAGLVVPRSGAVMLRDRAVASWSRPALARIMRAATSISSGSGTGRGTRQTRRENSWVG